MYPPTLAQTHRYETMDTTVVMTAVKIIWTSCLHDNHVDRITDYNRFYCILLYRSCPV